MAHSAKPLIAHASSGVQVCLMSSVLSTHKPWRGLASVGASALFSAVFCVEVHSHQKQIGIRPKLSKRIVINFNHNSFAQFGTNDNSWWVNWPSGITDKLSCSDGVVISSCSHTHTMRMRLQCAEQRAIPSNTPNAAAVLRLASRVPLMD